MKVLVAEDDVVQLRLLEVTLSKWGYHVLSARDGETAWKLLQEEDGPILAILDWMMPGYSGPQLSRLIRDQSSKLYTYIILLTARKDKESIIEGMDAGADDYLGKPYILDELAARIRAGKRILHLQEELVKAQEALREEAMRDPLTHLWNRRTIFTKLEAELRANRTTPKPVGIILADLDHFKQINDTRGAPVRGSRPAGVSKGDAGRPSAHRRDWTLRRGRISGGAAQLRIRRDHPGGGTDPGGGRGHAPAIRERGFPGDDQPWVHLIGAWPGRQP